MVSGLCLDQSRSPPPFSLSRQPTTEPAAAPPSFSLPRRRRCVLPLIRPPPSPPSRFPSLQHYRRQTTHPRLTASQHLRPTMRTEIARNPDLALYDTTRRSPYRYARPTIRAELLTNTQDNTAMRNALHDAGRRSALGHRRHQDRADINIPLTSATLPSHGRNIRRPERNSAHPPTASTPTTMAADNDARYREHTGTPSQDDVSSAYEHILATVHGVAKSQFIGRAQGRPQSPHGEHQTPDRTDRLRLRLRSCGPRAPRRAGATQIPPLCIVLTEANRRRSDNTAATKIGKGDIRTPEHVGDEGNGAQLGEIHHAAFRPVPTRGTYRNYGARRDQNTGQQRDDRRRRGNGQPTGCGTTTNDEEGDLRRGRHRFAHAGIPHLSTWTAFVRHIGAFAEGLRDGASSWRMERRRRERLGG
ncbi:hypothetical protein BJ912DRAFT_1069794 [Pholiota molesta]|nr:hypothetical protein BJ912DRAFT_1069794 [Pholiota molesta]